MPGPLLLLPSIAHADPASALDTGDTAWLLVSSAFVLLMTPGLALFYGGMVRKRNVLSTFMFVHFALAIITVQWVLIGYSLAFGRSHAGLIGGFDFVGLRGLVGALHGTVPHLSLHGLPDEVRDHHPGAHRRAFVERMRFTPYVVFALAWTTLVYDPVAHWAWAEGGWLLRLGLLDFAGGTVVHLTVGIAALLCALVIGKRRGYPREKHPPHNLTMTVIGGGLLWFGWFGFNAGSALSANAVAALAFVTTHVSAASAALAWVIVEWWHRGKPTMLGFVSGLVAITPAAGYVSPAASLLIGAAAGVGGILGALLTAVFAQKSLNPGGADGLLAGNAAQPGKQFIGVGVVGAYSAIVTYALLKLIDRTMGLRSAKDDELEGLGSSQHGESGYVM